MPSVYTSTAENFVDFINFVEFVDCVYSAHYVFGKTRTDITGRVGHRLPYVWLNLTRGGSAGKIPEHRLANFEKNYE